MFTDSLFLWLCTEVTLFFRIWYFLSYIYIYMYTIQGVKKIAYTQAKGKINQDEINYTFVKIDVWVTPIII